MGTMTYLRAQWDRAAGAGLVLLGALALLLGWIGVSGALYPAQQLPYLISGGLGGIFLLGLGATLWLSADLRDEWRHLDTLEADVERRLTDRVDALVAEALGTTAPATSELTRSS